MRPRAAVIFFEELKRRFTTEITEITEDTEKREEVRNGMFISLLSVYSCLFSLCFSVIFVVNSFKGAIDV